jgi:hypothetical protein
MSQPGFLMSELLMPEEALSTGDDGAEGASASVPWSFYAQNTFRRCQSEFLFGHIMANHHPTNQERREAFVLKQLQDLPTWRGSLVDIGIEKFIVPYLKSRQLPPLDEVVEKTLAVAQRQWQFSAQKRYWDPAFTKTANRDIFCALYPHEYGLPVGTADLEQVKADVRVAFETLYTQTRFLNLLMGHSWYRPKMRIHFRVAAASVKAELDLLFFRGNNQPTIIDWKAGHSVKSDYTWQMLVYALAVRRQWPEVQPTDIVVYEVNLAEGVIKNHPVTEERLVQTEDYIYQSVMEIKALTCGRKFSQQNLEAFDLANTPRTCAICNFRRLCLTMRARQEDHHASCESVWD